MIFHFFVSHYFAARELSGVVLIISSSPQLVSARTIMCIIDAQPLATPCTSLNRSKVNPPLSQSHPSQPHNRRPCLRGNSSGTADRTGHTRSPRPHHCPHQSHLTTHNHNRFRCRRGQCGRGSVTVAVGAFVGHCKHYRLPHLLSLFV